MKVPSEVFLNGNQRGIVLFHAYTGTSNDVRILAKRLHQEGYTVYCPNYSAHVGDNIDNFLRKTPNDWWQETVEAIEFLRSQGCQKIYAFGLSMGGMMATLAAKHQLVDGVGTFCSPITSEKKAILSLEDGLRKYCEVKLVEQGRSPAEIVDLEQAMTNQLQALASFSQLIYQQLSEISGPFYIAQGGADKLINPDLAIELKERLINAHVDFHWFEESGHVITIGKDKREFQESVVTFMKNN